MFQRWKAGSHAPYAFGQVALTLCQAKVCHLDSWHALVRMQRAERPGQEQVVWFQVEVHDAHVVQVGHAVDCRQRQLGAQLQRYPTLRQLVPEQRILCLRCTAKGLAPKPCS